MMSEEKKEKVSTCKRKSVAVCMGGACPAMPSASSC